MYRIQDRETGTIIDDFTELEYAEDALELYEMEDRENNVYEPNFYEIVEI